MATRAMKGAPGTLRAVWKIAAVLLVAAALAALIVLSKGGPLVSRILETGGRIEEMGSAGYLLFILVYAVVAVLTGPTWLMMVVAGFSYGLLRGTILSSIGAILGATAAFLIGRHFARDAVLKRVGERPGFKSIDEAVAGRGFLIVFLTRLSPLFPLTLLNYAYGITKVRLSTYFFASWIGMLPVTLMYVYSGTMVTDISRAAAGEMPASPHAKYFYYLGFAITVAVTLYITLLARKALKRAEAEKTGSRP